LLKSWDASQVREFTSTFFMRGDDMWLHLRRFTKHQAGSSCK
jgi:hypothetical protein